MKIEYIVYKVVSDEFFDKVLRLQKSFDTEKEAEDYISKRLSTPSNFGPLTIIKQYS